MEDGVNRVKFTRANGEEESVGVGDNPVSLQRLTFCDSQWQMLLTLAAHRTFWPANEQPARDPSQTRSQPLGEAPRLCGGRWPLMG
jgi:hypothetical protein